MHIFDISDPALPAEIAVFDTLTSAKGVAVEGNRLYIAADTLIGLWVARSSLYVGRFTLSSTILKVISRQIDYAFCWRLERRCEVARVTVKRPPNRRRGGQSLVGNVGSGDWRCIGPGWLIQP